MRMNTQDLTLARNYLQKYQFLITEYELVKAKQHPKFKFAHEFYKAHDTDRRSFLKYYNRFRQSGNKNDFIQDLKKIHDLMPVLEDSGIPISQ